MSKQVDFYLVQDTAAHWRFACRLLYKTFLKNHRVHVQLNNEAEMKLLDDLLWSFDDISFIPHRCINDRVDAPIVLSHSNTVSEEEETDLLINLSHSIPEFYTQFNRTLEIVSAAPEAKQQARQRFSDYRAQDCELNTHQV